MRIGTRASRLARVQTAQIVAALREAHPQLELEVVEVTTSGDRSQQTDAPDPAWGSGVFVKELEVALLREEIDLAVHSLKDVPPAPSAGLTLVAVPVREDPRDALVTGDGRSFDALLPGA